MTALDGTAVSDNCLRVHCLCCIDRDGIVVALCRIYLIRIPLRRILQQVFALTFILLWVVPLSAQQGIVVPSDSTVRYLEESVIVGHSQSGRYKETIPAQVLGGKDLERLNSLSVADALRYFSGVQLKDYGGVAGLKTINVRSLGTNHVAVFYDGIQLGNAQNGQTDLGRFSLDDIGEICLYNGQKSDIFQSARDFGSSSSIYITTSEPHFASGRRYSLKASVKTGSVIKSPTRFLPGYPPAGPMLQDVINSDAADMIPEGGLPTTLQPIGITETSAPPGSRRRSTGLSPTANGTCASIIITPTGEFPEPW